MGLDSPGKPACSLAHRCKKSFFTFFIIFIKRVFTFYLLERFFYFLVAIFCILLNLLNSWIKRLFSDGFNTAAIIIS